MEIVIADGGRKEAGYRGRAGDCVVRAIANITQKPYQEVYDAVSAYLKTHYPNETARTGVPKKATRALMEKFGGRWVPLMGIGTGCRVHLRAEELPTGRIICNLSGHVVAVIDRVIYDTYDPTRDGTRCVYGYWVF